MAKEQQRFWARIARYAVRRATAPPGSGSPVTDLLVTEPAVIDPAVAHVEATPEEIATADCVVLLADHDTFMFADVRRNARHVLDLLRVLSGLNVETL